MKKALQQVAGQQEAVERRARSGQQGARQLNRHVQTIQSNQRKSMKRVSLTQYLVEEQRQQQHHPGRTAPADRSGRARLQDHQPLGGQGRARRHPRQRRHREHPGRSAEEARRDLQRDPARSERVGRPPGRDGVGRNGNDPPDPEPLSDGRIPAAVRSAGRLVEHRRQRLDRHHLLGAEGAGRHGRSRPKPTSCSRAASRSRPATPCTARRPCWCSPPATA